MGGMLVLFDHLIFSLKTKFKTRRFVLEFF